jgi:hypothetical protein
MRLSRTVTWRAFAVAVEVLQALTPQGNVETEGGEIEASRASASSASFADANPEGAD